MAVADPGYLSGRDTGCRRTIRCNRWDRLGFWRTEREALENNTAAGACSEAKWRFEALGAKKIASLELARARPRASREELDQGILQVALDHHLISRLTSLVAVDITPTRPDGEALGRANVPHNLPEGWIFENVAAEQPARLQREAFATDLIKAQPDIAAPSPAGQGKAGVALPRGATLVNVKLTNGAIFLFFAAILLFVLRRPSLVGGAKNINHSRI